MTSSAFFHKPELALRRAIELQGIQQDEAALSLLHEVLSGPRRQRTWSPAFEQIIMAYLDLCLRLFRSREAKDGLHQYRNLSQTQAPGSLEKVIRYLMTQAEAKCAAAQAAVDQATLQQTTDTDEELGATPEAILLSTIAVDPAKSQRDSALLLPTLKFLWETYRSILDILRSSSKLEHVYHQAAQNALKFCQTYKRRVEFRHLTDMLRMHLGNLRQYGNLLQDTGTAATDENGRTNNKVRGWEGWTTESIELHLQTRFDQLETASVLHRYTEGFRTCEDIFNILQISQARRKADPDIPPPKAKLMASYYERLTTLFWVSENYLFHAFAWYKYYSLYKDFNRTMSEEARRLQASAVLLATLCIPSLPAGSSKAAAAQGTHGITSTAEDDIVKHKMARMATLLGFHTRNPTREALLAEIKSKDLLDQVPDYLRQLYFLLEENPDPLIMVQTAQPLLQKLRQEVGITNDSDEANVDVKDNTLGRYVKPLTQVLLLKLIVNLNKAYHTVSIEFLKTLTSGLGMSFEQVEKAIVVFTQTKTLSVRLDHRAGCLRFGNTQLESDAMRSQLTTLAKRLDTVVAEHFTPITPKSLAVSPASVFAEIRQNLAAEHQTALDRKNAIEQRKELEERQAQEKARAEERARQAEEAAHRKAEELRIAREQKAREQEKQRKIQEELDLQEKKRILVSSGKNVEEISNEQLANIDIEALQREQQDKVNKEKEEAERKTREAAKKLDHLVRAIRIEELPLIQPKYQERIEQERVTYEQENITRAEKAREQWEADVKAKKAMETFAVFEYMDDFESKVLAGRRAAHKLACEEAERVAEQEAELAKFRRARKRKEDEAKRLAAEEKRIAEEEERRREEELELAKEAARIEKDAKDEERRNAETRRLEEERETANSRPKAYVPPSKRGVGGRGGGSSAGGGSGNRFGGAGSNGGTAGGTRYPGGGRYDKDGRGGGGYDRRDGDGPSQNSQWRRDGSTN